MGKRSRQIPSQLGSKVLSIRLALGFSRIEMLKTIRPDADPDYAGSIIGEYERGKRAPSLLEILAYARAAGLSVETIIDDDLVLPDAVGKMIEVHEVTKLALQEKNKLESLIKRLPVKLRKRRKKTEKPE